MCGIVASFGSPGTAEREVLADGLLALRHRGPDANNVWINSAKSAALGHARLRIMDLATGDQPIGNEDGSIQAVVNGEFYGFESIRNALCAKGHFFKTRSDSEVLVHLYEEYGIGCLQHLRGEFSFIVWDERNQTAFAARDRFGIKPLFHAFAKERLLFASEAKALFCMGVTARWDQEAFYLNNYFVMPSNRTLFDSVMQVPPAHYLLVHKGGVQVQQYWSMDFPRDTCAAQLASDADCERLLLDSLRESIRVRLRSDVPVGCYLSGGIDSAAILCLASEESSTPIKAFSISFDNASYDEAAFAEEAARQAGAQLQRIQVRTSDLWENFQDAIYHSECVAFNTNGVAKFLLSRAVRDAGYRVVLTGEGSDEVLGGYPHFVRDAVLYGSNARAGDPGCELAKLQKQNLVFMGLSASPSVVAWLENVRTKLGYVPSLWSSFYPIGHALASLFSADFRAQYNALNPFDHFIASADVESQMEGRPVVSQSQYLWSKTLLPEYILKYLGDRMEMAHSIEGRIPFLDHCLFESIRHIPISQKIRGISEKDILKRAVKAKVPDVIIRRSKHPFAAPPACIGSNGGLAEFLQDMLSSESAQSLPFYDRRKVRNTLDGLRNAGVEEIKNLDAVLTSVASAYVLHDRFSMSA